MKPKGLKNKNGFTIVEIIITIVILGFGFVGIYGFFHPTSILTFNFSLHSKADYLAQEGFEVVKNIRDNNIISQIGWSKGLSDCQGGCQLDYKTGTAVETPANALQSYTGNPLNINEDGFYSYDNGTPSRFKRKIIITRAFLCQGDPTACHEIDNALKVDILIMWDYNGKPFIFETIGYIYDLS